VAGSLIRGGLVVDGTGAPAEPRDLGIRDGRLVPPEDVEPGARVVDASGLVVAPGFVDLHTHYDAQIRWDPWCTISGWHGVTSVVLGNCGFGFAPCKPDFRDRSMQLHRRSSAMGIRPRSALRRP